MPGEHLLSWRGQTRRRHRRGHRHPGCRRRCVQRETLYAGYLSSTAATANVYGIVNVSNGTLVVNSSLVLGYNPGAHRHREWHVEHHQWDGAGQRHHRRQRTNKITMTGGWLAVSNTLCTLAAPLSALTVSNGATLQFWVANKSHQCGHQQTCQRQQRGHQRRRHAPVLAYPSQYPLIYSPASGASGVKFALDTLPNGLPGLRVQRQLHTISLVVTNGPGAAQDGSLGRRREQ